jgi:hypothetical protein
MKEFCKHGGDDYSPGCRALRLRVLLCPVAHGFLKIAAPFPIVQDDTAKRAKHAKVSIFSFAVLAGFAVKGSYEKALCRCSRRSLQGDCRL